MHPVLHWPPHHVHPAETMLATLAWPCLLYGGWPNSKRCPLWRAYLRAEKHWLPTAEVQGCVQERHEGTRHNINSWEDLDAGHTSWRSTLHKQLQTSKKKLTAAAAEKQACKKETAANRPESMHRCDLCDRDCHSHIGLYSHRRHCSSRADSLDK